MFKSLLNNKFIKNVLIMVSGTMAAQIIALAAAPIITRLYSPEAYGVMGTFQSIIQVIIPLAALTYPVAIVLPKSDKEARSIMKLSFFITVILTVFSIIIFLVFYKQIALLLNLESIAKLLLLIPFIILFSGMMEIQEQWVIRTNQFKVAANTMVYRAILINSGRIGFGFIWPSANILVILTALENVLRSIMLKIQLNKSKYELNRVEMSKELSLKELALKYKDFPIYRAPQVLIDRFSQNMPVLLITSFFGPVTVGFYAIGRTVLGIPSQLIGKSIGDVFYPRIVEAINEKENATNLIMKATLGLFVAGVLPYGFIIIFGPQLFSFVFGSDWVIAGEYARWMAFWTFCMFLNRPSTKALPALNAQAFQLKFSILTLLLRLLALIAGAFIFNDALITIIIFSITAGILSIVLIILTIKISSRKTKEIKL